MAVAVRKQQTIGINTVDTVSWSYHESDNSECTAESGFLVLSGHQTPKFNDDLHQYVVKQ